MKKIIFYLLLFLFTPFSMAFSQADLIQLLQKTDNIQGNFVQKRFLKSLPTPIITSGEFTLVKNKGLLWQMQQPFTVNMRVLSSGISQWNGSQWVKNEQLGQNQQIGLFLGLFSGDISGLTNHFTPKVRGSAENWQLDLEPHSLLMSQIFTKITVQGQGAVQKIALFEKQGDRIEILFDQLKMNQPLSNFAQSALNE